MGPLAGALTLRSDLETLGNLLQINALLGQSGQAGDVEQRIGALEDKVAAGLEAIPTSDPQLQARREELSEIFTRARNESSLQSKAALFDKLLVQAQVLTKQVASQSGLDQTTRPRCGI